MRIAKPLLSITTPLGVGWGVYEAWRLTGGLVILMVALLGFIGVAMGSVVLTIRRERAQEAQSAQEAQRSNPSSP